MHRVGISMVRGLPNYVTLTGHYYKLPRIANINTTVRLRTSHHHHARQLPVERNCLDTYAHPGVGVSLWLWREMVFISSFIWTEWWSSVADFLVSAHAQPRRGNMRAPPLHTTGDQSHAASNSGPIREPIHPCVSSYLVLFLPNIMAEVSRTI